MAYVLGLDVGTTAVKAVLFDVEGRAVADAAAEYTLETPGPDLVELDCEVYWAAVVKVLRSTLSGGEIARDRILSVGVTSQAETLIALDKDGRPLRKAIVWLDNRTHAEAEEIGRCFDLDEVYRVTGQQEIIPTWTATRILWLQRHEPRLFERVGKYLMVEDYIIFRLTGEYATDPALNPSTLYFDIERGDWWDRMVDFLGVSRQQLPALIPSGQVAGAVCEAAARETGLGKGIPVTTAPIDQVAGAVGAGNTAPGVATETTGAAFAICATTDRPVYDPQKRLALALHAVPGRYALLAWAPTGGMVFRWFRDEFGSGADYSTLVREAERVAPGAAGLILLPYLSGAGSPEFDPRARGVFWGMTLGHSRAHFTRAVLESVAFMLRANLELLESLGAVIGELRSLGGAARSETWLQIKADVCGRDLTVMECEEAACLGVAMLSCVGTGVYGDLDTARENMVRTKRVVCSRSAESEAYESPYRAYLDLYQNVKALF